MIIPPVSRYMTSNPHAVAPRDNLASVSEVMRHYNVRHMPVLENGALVGILSDRDLLPSYALDDTVSDAMTPDVTTVFAEMPIDDVVALMRERRVSAVIIAGATGIQGIFTFSDIARAFCDLIRPERSPVLVIPLTSPAPGHASDTD